VLAIESLTWTLSPLLDTKLMPFKGAKLKDNI
jgi:hypothetical protein